MLYSLTVCDRSIVSNQNSSRHGHVHVPNPPLSLVWQTASCQTDRETFSCNNHFSLSYNRTWHTHEIHTTETKYAKKKPNRQIKMCNNDRATKQRRPRTHHSGFIRLMTPVMRPGSCTTVLASWLTIYKSPCTLAPTAGSCVGELLHAIAPPPFPFPHFLPAPVKTNPISVPLRKPVSHKFRWRRWRPIRPLMRFFEAR